MDILNLKHLSQKLRFFERCSDCEHPFSTDTHTQILTVIHCLNVLREYDDTNNTFSWLDGTSTVWSNWARGHGVIKPGETDDCVREDEWGDQGQKITTI